MMSKSVVAEIVARHPDGRESLIPILQEIQDTLGYLSEGSLRELAGRTGISENEIYGVATFYAQFRFRPPAEHSICVCLGTACHVRGGRRVLWAFEKRLGIRAGQMTEDGKFDLSRVACLGCCALGPTVSVDGEVHAHMTPQKARAMVARHAEADSPAR
jgi:NADH-quinone oxidoreductase subunit E